MVRCPEEPVWPAMMTFSSSVVLPARPGLAAQNVVFAHDTSMTDLHETVDLRSALNTRLAEGGAVHRGQCLNFHIVFDHRNARLRDLVMRALLIFGEAEAIAANNYAVMQVTRLPMRVYSRTDTWAVRREVIANSAAFVDDDMGM